MFVFEIPYIAIFAILDASWSFPEPFRNAFSEADYVAAGYYDVHPLRRYLAVNMAGALFHWWLLVVDVLQHVVAKRSYKPSGNLT